MGEDRKVVASIVFFLLFGIGFYFIDQYQLRRKAEIYEKLTGKKVEPRDMRWIEIRADVGAEK